MAAFEIDLQAVEKRDRTREVFGQDREDLGRISRDREALESRNVRNCQKERFLAIECVISLLETDPQGESLRTFDVDACFVGICAIQAGPQGGKRNEKFPPATTHVGQLDQGFVLVAIFQVDRDEGKDFRRGFVDECEGVLHRPDQAEHLQCVIFKSVDLKIWHL